MITLDFRKQKARESLRGDVLRFVSTSERFSFSDIKTHFSAKAVGILCKDLAIAVSTLSMKMSNGDVGYTEDEQVALCVMSWKSWIDEFFLEPEFVKEYKAIAAIRISYRNMTDLKREIQSLKQESLVINDDIKILSRKVDGLQGYANGINDARIKTDRHCAEWHLRKSSFDRLAMKVESAISDIAEIKDALISAGMINPPHPKANVNLVDLDLSIRLLNAMKSAEINTFGELMKTPLSEIKRFRNVGERSISEIKALMKAEGVTLKD